MKRLFSSDLHPERGTNKELKRYLKREQKAGTLIYFVGDRRMIPDTYRKDQTVSIQGNHEMELRRLTHSLQPAYQLRDDILLIHGHNAEAQAQAPVVYLQDGRDLVWHTWKWLTVRKRSALGTRHYTMPVGRKE